MKYSNQKAMILNYKNKDRKKTELKSCGNRTRNRTHDISMEMGKYY